jgi:diguanylate cyclase (GGDEF)-like protein
MLAIIPALTLRGLLFRRIKSALCLLLLLFASPWGYSATPSHILLINSWSKDLPWQVSVEQGLLSELDKNSASSSIYTEYLDAERFPNKKHHATLNQYLHEKYKNIPIDLIIAESLPASQFLSNAYSLLPNAKRIYLPDSNKPLRHIIKSNEIVIPIFEDYYNSFKEMQRLAKPKHIYIVADNQSESGRNQLERFNKATYALRENIEHSYLMGEPLEAIIKKTSNLPEQSVIFYLLVFQDVSGKNYIPYQVASKLAQAANAPIFSEWKALMGSGIVGGYLISGERVGQVAARSALEFFRNSKQTSTIQDTFGYYYDATALERWNINESALPQQAQILYQTPDYFEVYKYEIAVTGIAVILMSLFSVALLLVNHNRKVAIHELEFERMQLESRVIERTKELEQAMTKAEEDARTDVLTRLANRRAFFEQGKNIHLLARRYDRHYSLIVLDIDHFKDINDIYGHAIGDNALVALAEKIRENTRESDVSARIGGEEFAIVIPETTSETVIKLAERLLKSVAALQVPVPGGHLSFTVSIGVAQLLPEHDSLEEVLLHADEAMYAAKNAGRNQIVAALPMDLPDHLG